MASLIERKQFNAKHGLLWMVEARIKLLIQEVADADCIGL